MYADVGVGDLWLVRWWAMTINEGTGLWSGDVTCGPTAHHNPATVTGDGGWSWEGGGTIFKWDQPQEASQPLTSHVQQLP